jgi:hypothetical protein
MTFIRFQNFRALEKPKDTEIDRAVMGSLLWFRPKYLGAEAAKQLIT